MTRIQSAALRHVNIQLLMVFDRNQQCKDSALDAGDAAGDELFKSTRLYI